MASPPSYARFVNRPTGIVTINPVTGIPSEAGIPTEVVPAGALTPSGQWVPFLSDENGILYVQMDTSPGASHYDDAQADTTPGAQQVLLEQTVPDGVTRAIMQAFVVTRVMGYYLITANGSIIGSGRTGPGGTNGFSFLPARALAAGTVYQVLFCSRAGSPVQSVECFIQATDTAQ